MSEPERTIDGLTIEDWRTVAKQATARISAAERTASRTVDQHWLGFLVDVRDRILGPTRLVTRDVVRAVLDEIEAEIVERAANRD